MSSSLSTRIKITSKLPVVADVNAAWHTQTITQTLAQLETDAKTGLTDRQIAQLQQEFGANELVAAASRQWWQILFDQFTNIMLVMLIFVALSCQTFKTLFLSSRTLAVRDSVKIFRCKTA